MLTFKQLQSEVAEWSNHNFPGKEPVDPLLGMQEEIGEIAHAFLKMKQGIRGTKEEHRAAIIDGVADLLVFTADFCHQNGIDLQAGVEETWGQVKQRDWRKFPKNGLTA